MSCPANNSPILTLPLLSPDSHRLIGRILIQPYRPFPLCILLLSSTGTLLPVRINCPISPRLSTSLRTISHNSGMVCHSSINRGVSPSNMDLGSICNACIVSRKVIVSPKLSRLRATCFAVVVFPHHLGPCTKTAPLPCNLRFNMSSAIRCLYTLISSKNESNYFDCKITDNK